MHGLLKKLLVLNGYMEESGADGGAGGGGTGGSGTSTNELANVGGAGGAPGSEDAGGAGSTLTDPAVTGPADVSAATESAAKPVTEDPVAKRYADLTKQAREAQERETRTRAQLDAALAAVERLTGAVAPKPADEVKPAVDEPPAPPVFEDPEQYQRDMAVYAQKLAERSAKQALATAEADRKRIEIEAQNAETQRIHAETWAGRRTAALEKYPDYAEVAESPKVPISAAAALTITSMENGADVAYYLGQHLEEAQRIFALPPVRQAVELGKLEMKLTAPKPVPVSKAADPIKPLTGAGASQTRSDDELSMEEYAAKRNGTKR